MKNESLVLTPCGLRFLGRRFPCSIGYGGLSDQKREGDGATPRGKHRIIGMLYRPDRLQKPNSWARPIRRGQLWSDDPEAADYNSMVSAPYDASHERLFRADRLYDLVILTDWNWHRPVKGHGSAVFLHRWRRRGYPTEGCIALGPADLMWIAHHLNPQAKLIV